MQTRVTSRISQKYADFAIATGGQQRKKNCYGRINTLQPPLFHPNWQPTYPRKSVSLEAGLGPVQYSMLRKSLRVYLLVNLSEHLDGMNVRPTGTVLLH